MRLVAYWNVSLEANKFPIRRVLKQVELAINESRIAERITDQETQVMIAQLFRRCDIIAFATKNGENEILSRLDQQSRRYEMFVNELHDDLTSISYKLQQLATSQQSKEIIDLQLKQNREIDEIKSLLTQHMSSNNHKKHFTGCPLPEKARQQLAVSTIANKIKK